MWNNRNNYLNLIKKFYFNKDIKIIIGPRRIGKSFLMTKIKEQMLITNSINEENILELNFNKKDILKSYTWEKLIKNELQRCKDKKENFVLFIDEVQELKNFEDALISLQAYIDEGKINLDIYVTGSNNKKLSSKISSNFTGRHNDFILYPYDFHELLEFYSYIFNNIKISNNYEKSLFLYSYFGGFGKIIFEIEKNKDIFQRWFLDDNWFNSPQRIEIVEIFGLIWKQILNDILKKDIFIKIKNLNSFLKVFDYVFDNIGKELSSTKIVEYFKSNLKISISHLTIEEWIDKLKDTGIINEVNFWDIKGKRILKTSPKYYCCDLGLLSFKNNYKFINTGFFLENLVYINLINKFKKDNIYTYYSNINNTIIDVDFLITNKNGLIFIEVSENLTTKDFNENSNYEKKIKNMQCIKNFYKKIIITKYFNSNPKFESFVDLNGIMIVSLYEWLYGNIEQFL